MESFPALHSHPQHSLPIHPSIHPPTHPPTYQFSSLSPARTPDILPHFLSQSPLLTHQSQNQEYSPAGRPFPWTGRELSCLKARALHLRKPPALSTLAESSGGSSPASRMSFLALASEREEISEGREWLRAS